MSIPNTQKYSLRRATSDDVEFLAFMATLALFRHFPEDTLSPQELLEHSYFGRYVRNWPGVNDLGIIAEIAGKPIGACWWRVADTKEKEGFGFIDPSIPEVSIAIITDWRAQGIGTLLLVELIKLLDQSQFQALSLAVEIDNPALHLYKRVGFVEIACMGETLVMLLQRD